MRLPIYQHPSLTVLVDDSEASLARLQFALGAAVVTKAFSDQRQALGWLRRQTASAPREQLLSASVCDTDCMQQHCSVTLDVDRIFRIGFRPQRFMQPSVLVVDYRMAKMNGVQFCEALADLPCKKVLLSDAGDEHAVLDAFNRGLIDRVVRKGDDDALVQLGCTIAALQQQYFAELSDALRALLVLHSFSFLGDPAIASLVRELSRAHGIVEHYLYPQPSGLLLFDATGRARLMAIETDHGMDVHHEVARDSGAPRSLLEAIDARCIIPCFRNGDGMYADTVGERWYRYCAPAQVCHGAQPYYWALFDLGASELPEPPAPFARFQAGFSGAA
ncbi:MAG TPA: response regulator [Telluria sp.]|nr:response regulator [Telluria sp.]